MLTKPRTAKALTGLVFILLCSVLGLFYINSAEEDWNFPVRLKSDSEQSKDRLETKNCFAAFKRNYRKTHKHKIPIGMDKWYTFATARNCSLDEKLYQRIYSDLLPFRNAGGITKEMINQAKSWVHLNPFEIKNGSYSTNHPDFNVLKSFVADLPDMVLFFNPLDEPRVLRSNPLISEDGTLLDKYGLVKQLGHDYGFNPLFNSYSASGTSVEKLMRRVCDKDKIANNTFNLHGFFTGPTTFSTTANLLPILSVATIDGCFNDIVIPNHWQFGQRTSVTSEVPGLWNDKIEQLHWRGSSTGGQARPGNLWREFHRHRLVHKFKDSGRDDIEVLMAAWVQCEGSCDYFNDYLGPLSDKENENSKHYFKYIIDIDGNSFTERFLPLLRFNNVILKITAFRDWVFDRVEPWKHYIPVGLDFVNLLPNYEWARANPVEAAEIARLSTQFARDNLRLEDMECYIYRLLLEYAALQT